MEQLLAKNCTPVLSDNTGKNQSKKKFFSSKRLEKENASWPRASGGTGSLLAACSEFGIKAGEQVSVAVLGWCLTLTLPAGGFLREVMVTCCSALNCFNAFRGLGSMASLSGYLHCSGIYPKKAIFFILKNNNLSKKMGLATWTGQTKSGLFPRFFCA